MMQGMSDDVSAREQPPKEYVRPAIEVLGTLEELTRGPAVGSGDLPEGVITF